MPSKVVQGVEQLDCGDVRVEEGGGETGAPVRERLPESLSNVVSWGLFVKHGNHLHVKLGGEGKQPFLAVQEEESTGASPRVKDPSLVLSLVKLPPVSQPQGRYVICTIVKCKVTSLGKPHCFKG